MYVAARGVGCCCKLALGAIWALSPRPSSPPHSPSSHSTQVMTLLVTAAPNLKAGYWDNDRGLGMKCTHGTEVWGDTRSEKHLKKFKSSSHQFPSLFWGLQQLGLLSSCSNSSFPSFAGPVQGSGQTLPTAPQHPNTQHNDITIMFQGSKHYLK